MVPWCAPRYSFRVLFYNPGYYWGITAYWHWNYNNLRKILINIVKAWTVPDWIYLQVFAKFILLSISSQNTPKNTNQLSSNPEQHCHLADIRVKGEGQDLNESESLPFSGLLIARKPVYPALFVFTDDESVRIFSQLLDWVWGHAPALDLSFHFD